ncbi:MAG TPA: NnrS family protein [Xanthomonadales bacterium]|nr:NnrS family protein [Xanthomonadales bacterium]
MNSTTQSASHDRLDLAELARLFAAAPHRLLFFAGASAVLLSMAWWAIVLAGQRFGTPAPAVTVVPPGWLHAVTLQYQMLAPFIFGFLLTVMPRWTGTPPHAARHYVPAAGTVLAGYVVTLAGAFGVPHAIAAGIALTLAGWLVALALLARTLWLDAGRTLHAVSCWMALALGAIGLALFVAYLALGDARYAFASIKFGTFAFLLPMYVGVSHRMIPFFSQAVLPDFAERRPMWMLGAFWALALAHLFLELAHAYAWLWPVDLALAALTLRLALLWRPWRARKVRLLWALHLAFAWLPVAFLLYAAQSIWFAATGDFVLGRAPVHALTVGYFGSMLVAMVTRVTQGHSGRPLEMGPIAWTCFIAINGVALLRIGAEFAADAPLWQTLAAVAWLLAFAPWVARNLIIYATPRIDGKPG